MWPAIRTAELSSWANHPALTLCGRVTAHTPRERSQRRTTTKRQAAAQRPLSKGYIIGQAVRFETLFAPSSDDYPRGTRFMLAKGALDHWLHKVERGKACISLCFYHTLSTATATTADGSLSVTVLGDGVAFEVLPTSADGRLAIAVARNETNCRSVSVGMNPVRVMEADLDGTKLIIGTRMELKEISLVPAGACPGVWCVVK